MLSLKLPLQVQFVLQECMQTSNHEHRVFILRKMGRLLFLKRSPCENSHGQRYILGAFPREGLFPLADGAYFGLVYLEQW